MPAPDPPTDPAAVLAEATRRSALVWVATPERPARPAWHVWHDGAVWLLVARAEGSPEQPVPGLLEAERARLTVRSKDTGARAVTFDAEVRVVEAGSPEWDDLLPLLLAARLNVPDGVAGAPERWARECALLRLDPVLPLVEGPGALPTGSHAAPPRPSVARTPTPSPSRAP